MNQHICNSIISAVLIISLGLISSSGFSQPLPRPEFPRVYNREDVLQYINAIDRPYNASILKFGYFLRRRNLELPVDQGFLLLKAATKKETIGSKKWFYMQNVCGFAAFRVPDFDIDEGFSAYNILFDTSKDSIKSQSIYILRQSIDEYVSTVQGRLGDLGLQKDQRTKDTLTKAFSAYLVLLGAEGDKRAGNASEPPFVEAIRATEIGDRITPIVEKVLADPEIPKNYNLLKIAVNVLAPKQPAKALALLQQAKPLLPKNKLRDGNEILDLNEAGHFYTTWIDLLESNGRSAEAIAIAQERVQLTNYGRARLLDLQEVAGNAADAQQTLSEIAAPTSDERDVLAAADALYKRTPDLKTSHSESISKAEKLLEGYLASPRPRQLEYELLAHLQLGNYYLSQKEYAKARAVLTVTEISAPISSRAGAVLREIQRLRQELKEKP